MTKSRDLNTRQRSLTFEVDYPEAEEGIQPRHRFMSAYEQKVETKEIGGIKKLGLSASFKFFL